MTLPSAAPRTLPRGPRSSWVPTTLLIALGLLPVVGSRLAAMASGTALASGEAWGGPVPTLLHIVGATVFVVLGAFQFRASFRRRRPRWHRLAGRVVLAGGLLAAFTGLWINQFGQRHGDLLYTFRLLAGVGMILGLTLGLRAVLRKNIPAHRAWMMRAYAIGLGAGTQVFALGFGKAIFGEPEVIVALLNLTGWVLNLAVAELLIARGARRRPRFSRAGAGSPQVARAS